MSALPPLKYLLKRAELSDDGVYRYNLFRIWDYALPVLVFVMLNPSTANADVDDPTIRKCVGFARRNGFGGICVVNLWAFRATDPAALRACAVDPVGPANDYHLGRALDLAAETKGKVLAAWGVGARLLPWMRTREEAVRGMLQQHADVYALRTTAGCPHHPLMLSYELTPQLLWARRQAE